MVTKKLCTTLTTYFVRSPVTWKMPLTHLARCLQVDDYAPELEADDEATVLTLLPDLRPSQVILLLIFSAALADEVSKVDADSPAHAALHDQMEAIVQDASMIIATALSNPDYKVRTEALKAFLTWVNYAQPVWPRKPEPLQHLRDLTELVAQCVAVPELHQDALEVLRDILESYTSFFTARHMFGLFRIVTEHVQPRLLTALENVDPEGVPYGQLVIAYGVANVQPVVEQPDNDMSRTIIDLHFEILRSPGYPGGEDEISIHSIEFWNTYIEYVNDTVFSQDSGEPPLPWLPNARSILEQLIELLWTKMRIPTGQIAKEWTNEESGGFREFRLDATDLMLSVYVFLGKDMLRQLASFALRSLRAKDWRSVEAALFCMNAIADNVLEESSNEEALDALFSSALFREINDFNLNIPAQARRTAIDVLGSYGSYIERHAEYLPDAVRFLFASLETAALATTAAKSIAALCSACRGSLTGELDGFLQQYQRFLSGPTSDPYTKEKVIGAIAAIIQALKPESTKVQPLLLLIENVEKDVQTAKECVAAGERDMAEVMGVTGLNCLASIGKNLQVPDDVPISIYDNDEQPPPSAHFWNSEEAQVVRQRIMGCFSVLQVLGNDGEAIDAACQVLRSGFAETEPGPFVMPPSVTVSFLQQCSTETPHLESVLSTACILVTQHSKSTSERIPEDVDAICACVAGLIAQLGLPERDPGVAQGCIDLFSRLVPYYTHVLIGKDSRISGQLPAILDFTLRAIEGQDVFPKRSACELWTKLLKSPSISNPPDVQQRLTQVVHAYCPQLAQALMGQVGGLCQRSELDYVCEPLKALITNQPNARAWLEGALADSSFPQTSESVGQAEKRRFLQQIVGLRGDSRKTKDVVKEFWAACRGTVVRYN
ncbi:hypothetical protein BAUCODRAFT_33115 [Baudoinia panamericana UAMH 10762]|uniref:Exportin-1/Importin-beta-like domain-containing protein n=1 Tax=Baudoinia panamericana (strain UAMH 10762) TaxID=717646 RepID=M2NDV4_BAUPA|nr:uncharacterized protein BAUCODRAFT_33115 [Baudoinia panamericana UAMH 10762]EMC97399.1 hypothetical protein BAUCODRAFT_33115 [Baudoinia panamericana UAMH 10762]